jgi:hypothetical protein
VKRKWTKSTELIYRLLDSPVELFANELLIFEYEKYARALGSYELLDYLKKSVIHANPSQEEIDACAPFFPESELADIVHAATCLYADAILNTNDNHFIKIKNSGVIKVWSNTKAIKKLLDGIDDYKDPKSDYQHDHHSSHSRALPSPAGPLACGCSRSCARAWAVARSGGPVPSGRGLVA